MHTRLKTLTRTLAMAGVMAGSALLAVAQTTPPAPMPAAGASAPMRQHGHKDTAHMEAMVAKHLSELKTKLKITPTQEASWTIFTAAMKPAPRPDPGHTDRAALDKLTTPERIDSLRAMRSQHVADRQAYREKRENAIKAFYADLNPEQKKTFDAEHSTMMRRWHDRMKSYGHRAESHAAPAPTAQ